MQRSPLPQADGQLRGRYQANIRKFYLFQFLLNLQLWWPIWVIYLTEERGLTLTTIDLRDEYDYDVPTAAKVTKRVPCSACGLSKRHFFDKAALYYGEVRHPCGSRATRSSALRP